MAASSADFHFFEVPCPLEASGAAKIDKNQSSHKNPATSFLDPNFDEESEFQRVTSSKYHLGYDMSVKRPKNTILGPKFNF